jgi:hypothetical protein
MNTTPRPAAAPAAHFLNNWLHAWDRFWFRPADPTVLGLIRIACGLVVLYVHFAYSYDLQAFFGRDAWFSLSLANMVRHEAPWGPPPADWTEQPVPRPLPADPVERAKTVQYMQRWGADPRTTPWQGNYFWSVWFHVTDPATMRWVHAGVLAVVILFTLGAWTRVMSVLTWLAALSYIQRSPITLFGMDTIISILLLYLMIGPSGAALSVDRLVTRYRAVRRGLPPPTVEPLVSANLALRLMQVHFCIIYGAAGLSKLLGGAWWNGTALWGTLVNYEFSPVRFPVYAEALRWLCRHRWLWEVVMSGGAVYTLALEIGFPFLVWQRDWRGPMVIGAVLLHTGISLTMGLVGFGLLMLTLVLSFVPAAAVHLVFQRAKVPMPLVRPWLGRRSRAA